jgi:LPS export ABC transporter protein LptC
MKYQASAYRIFSKTIIIPFLTLILIGCENKNDKLPLSDIQNLPTLSRKDFETIYSDSGKIELIMRSPMLEQYDNAGLYDGKPSPTGSVTSKYAKYTQGSNVWELKDSVVVINENKDKLETEVLYWDQSKDLIYSDRFVKFTNEDQIVMGTGFESDPHLRKRKIKKVSATIYLKDEE